jgi:Rrf2 family nitric oxide-sensitive transcriptional repressor
MSASIRASQATESAHAKGIFQSIPTVGPNVAPPARPGRSRSWESGVSGRLVVQTCVRWRPTGRLIWTQRVICSILYTSYCQTIVGMQLTRHTDYGLRILIYLALEPARRVPAWEIADAFAVSQNHIMKVIKNLARHGIIVTHRGKGGGIALAVAPEDIRVGTVVRLLEGKAEIVNCTAPRCPVLPACRLRTALAAAFEAFLGELDTYTLAHLVKHREAELRDLLPIHPQQVIGHG